MALLLHPFATAGSVSIMSHAGLSVYCTFTFVAPVPFAMSRRLRRVSVGCVKMYERVSVTSSSSESTGKRCCSPSVYPGASAEKRQMYDDSVSVGPKSNVAFPVSPVFTDTVFSCLAMTRSVYGSSSVMVAFTLIGFSERFATEALTVALSPLRRKRGMRGCIMSCFWATASSVMSAWRISLSCATAMKRHVVTLSGRVKRNDVLPFASVTSAGMKKAVSLKFSRYICSAGFCSSAVSSAEFMAALPTAIFSSVSISTMGAADAKDILLPRAAFFIIGRLPRVRK